MTFTRFPLLAAAACLIALSGCDAVGPESVSAAPASATATAEAGVGAEVPSNYFIAPLVMSLGSTCVVRVVSERPVVTWNTSPGIEVVRESRNAALLRSVASEGTRERVMVITRDGTRVTHSIDVKANAANC